MRRWEGKEDVRRVGVGKGLGIRSDDLFESDV